VEVSGSMRADLRADVREAGVCGTGGVWRSVLAYCTFSGTCERWIRRRQAISVEVTTNISHFLCWVYAPCSSARTSVDRADACTWWRSALET
jgi:hypothetical protein